MNCLNPTATGRHIVHSRTTSLTALTCMIFTGLLSMSTVSVANTADIYALAPLTSNTVTHSNLSSYRLNFRYREETGVIQRPYSKNEILDVKPFRNSDLNIENNLEQYDATIYYAVTDSSPSNRVFSPHQWLSIDLGVNFKFIEQTYETKLQHNFRTHYGAYPMVSATALFDLPFSGVTASVEGSYFTYKARELSEYRAIVSYQIDNIFGVSGGWEQQQYQLDSAESLRFVKEGPFVDLFYRF